MLTQTAWEMTTTSRQTTASTWEKVKKGTELHHESANGHEVNCRQIPGRSSKVQKNQNSFVQHRRRRCGWQADIGMLLQLQTHKTRKQFWSCSRVIHVQCDHDWFESSGGEIQPKRVLHDWFSKLCKTTRWFETSPDLWTVLRSFECAKQQPERPSKSLACVCLETFSRRIDST